LRLSCKPREGLTKRNLAARTDQTFLHCFRFNFAEDAPPRLLPFSGPRSYYRQLIVLPYQASKATTPDRLGSLGGRARFRCSHSSPGILWMRGTVSQSHV
jgi:hypothetical protein